MDGMRRISSDVSMWSTRPRAIPRCMSEGVRADMRRFLEAYESDPVDPKALKIKGVGAQQVVEVLKSVYLR